MDVEISDLAVYNLIARDRIGFRNRDRFPDFNLPKWCQGCHRITDLRECWGCHRWFCYECLIEHMMGCKQWQEIKGDYEILFECEKYETCDDCKFRFKCYTRKKIPKRKK